jgi:hypothetical protein
MRLPLIHPADLDPVQRDLYDDMRAGIATGFDAFRAFVSTALNGFDVPAPEQDSLPL